MRAIMIVLAVMMFSGCASVQHNRLTKEPLPKLVSSGSAYIMVPANAIYYTKECIGSGKVIAETIYKAFQKHMKRVEVAPEGEKLEEGLQKAKSSSFTYLVNSKISRWEDYVTEWNGKLDMIDMQMDILDVSSGKTIDSVNFNGNGTWWTFGGYHPQHILTKAMDEYIANLF